MELHKYQKRIANFIAKHDNCVLSVDMGLGKTASVLAWLDWYERKNNYSKRVLIVAPKNVAENNWMQEMKKWSLIELYQKTIIAAGTAKKRAICLLDKTTPIKVISRNNIKDVKNSNFDVLIIDELTSFKSINANRTKTILSINAEHKIGLTGTFLANGAIDIFGQCAAVGITWKNTNFYAWRASYFRDALAGSGLQYQKWKLNVPLIDLLQPIKEQIFTLTAEDYLEIPSVTETTHEIVMDEETAKAIEDLDAFLSCNVGGELLAFNEGQKFAKLQTLCNGFVYLDSGDVKRSAESKKLVSVVDFVEECKDAGEHVLLFYAFREELAWIEELMEERKIKYATPNTRNFMQLWNDGEIDCLLAHPASAGHGLNLQHGGRIIVWSTLTYNYEYFAQANARLARQGQKRNVQIHYFIAKDTCEKRVVRALSSKQKEQKEFLKLTKE